ncbi:hypothetical protein OO013_15510 [Mangrovivirga sp. M17]|uniref:Uncharacterized protein n=1 Tax=Mangrovivirga halotolerans TaxID=2993936 RepID=A0ABT3RVU8_9BACT|nr:hypothetical protein [Mangrovivirga halotolerans]MCX2745285.1 hypothetical protein [Mangrovivirga halotolerans]
MAKLLFSFLALFLTPDEGEKKEVATFFNEKKNQAEEILLLKPELGDQTNTENRNDKSLNIYF